MATKGLRAIGFTCLAGAAGGKGNNRMTKSERDRRNALERARYRINSKPFIDATVKWKRNHPDKFLEYQRRWQKKNRKRINVQRRARYQANAQKFRARSLAWSKAHAEQVAKTKRKCYYASRPRSDGLQGPPDALVTNAIAERRQLTSTWT
jgi:hypothetical protein